MASAMYNRGARLMSDGTIDWDGATDVRILLTTSSYTPDRDHNFVSDVTNELSGGGYVRKATASRSVTEDDANDRVILDLADVTYTALGAVAGTPKYAVFYVEAGTDATRALICWIDLGSAPAPNGGDYTLQWDGTVGILTVTT